MDLLWNHLQALGSDRSIFELAESWSCLMSIMLFSHLVWSLPPPSPGPAGLFLHCIIRLNRCTFASAMWITLWLQAAADHCWWFWNSIPFRLSLRLVLDLAIRVRTIKNCSSRITLYIFFFFFWGGRPATFLILQIIVYHFVLVAVITVFLIFLE